MRRSEAIFWAALALASGVIIAAVSCCTPQPLPAAVYADIADYAAEQLACLYMPDASYDDVTACRDKVKARYGMLDGGTQ